MEGEAVDLISKSRSLITMEARLYIEPVPRRGHVSAPAGDKVCLYGGGIRSSFEEKDSLHQFDLLSRRWTRTRTEGPKLRDASSVSVDTEIYIYGGYDGSDYLDSLHQLSTKTGTWKELVGQGGRPMRKQDSGMVHYEHKLFIMGGYGIPSGPMQPGATFREYRDGRGIGWTNELHCFNLKDGRSNVLC